MQKSINIDSGKIFLMDPAIGAESDLFDEHSLLVKSGDWYFDFVKEVGLDGDELSCIFLFHKEHMRDILNKNHSSSFDIELTTSQICFSDAIRHPQNTGDYADIDSFFFKASVAADTDNVLGDQAFCFYIGDRKFTISVFKKNSEIVAFSIDFSS